MTPKRLALLGLALVCVLAGTVQAQVEPFKKKVGDVKVQDVTTLPESDALEMPFILWGGDVATFHANGGLSTKKDSIFNKLGLKLKLKPGDDFTQQVKDYVEGKSAFLRGTFSMIGLASEVIGDDPRTKPVIFLQMTWSRGDHMVGRESIKVLNDLKGKTVCLQRDGPHVGMLNDILNTAKLTWKDIKVVWVDDISGPKGPAEAFAKDDKIDACFVITPDMDALTGGLTKKGDGQGGTVKGAAVVVSTAQLSRSIADVYACRKDYFDKNKELIEKFTAGYLKAVEEVQAMKPGKDKDGKPTGDAAAYKALTKLAVDVYGQNAATKEAVPNEAAADGLISDCDFTGLADNNSFFKGGEKNLVGFLAKQKSALDLAVNEGYAAKRIEFIPVDFDYTKLKTMVALKEALNPVRPQKFLDERIGTVKPIASFTISFAANQDKFEVKDYGADFQRAVEQAAQYADAVVEIRGHADGHNMVTEILKSGVMQGIIKDAGGGNYTLKDGTKVDVKDVAKLLDLVAKENFSADDKKDFPEGAAEMLKLSNGRAQAVKDAIVKFATDKGVIFDESQLKSRGVGVLEPASIVLPPRNDERAKNRRVEFRIVAVVPEGK